MRPKVWYIDDDDGGIGNDVRGDGTLAKPFATVEGALIRIFGDYPDPRGMILDTHSRNLSSVPPCKMFP